MTWVYTNMLWKLKAISSAVEILRKRLSVSTENLLKLYAYLLIQNLYQKNSTLLPWIFYQHYYIPTGKNLWGSTSQPMAGKKTILDFGVVSAWIVLIFCTHICIRCTHMHNIFFFIEIAQFFRNQSFKICIEMQCYSLAHNASGSQCLSLRILKHWFRKN